MIRLINGLIFGLGLGLITVALDGMTSGHSLWLHFIGTALLFTAIGGVLFRMPQTK